MKRFTAEDCGLDGLKLITRRKLEDTRGYLSRIFCSDELVDFGWNGVTQQINHTFTARAGTIRGMHFQTLPYPDAKIVTCISGAVFDVAIDLRKSSRTFLHWYATELTGENCKSLFIPPGFAHGFQCLTDGCHMLYAHNEKYHPTSEGGLNAMDPMLAIAWPRRVTERSERDAAHPMLTSSYEGIFT